MPSDWWPEHMTAAQSVTSADTVTQTLLETGWVSPPQIQRLCVLLQQQNLVMTIISETRWTGQTANLILPDVASGFPSD